MLFLDFSSLWNEMVTYLQETYGHVELTGYDHLPISSTASTLSIIIFGLAIGLAIASIVSLVQKVLFGRPVRFLLSRQAHNPKEALSLSELKSAVGSIAAFSFRHNLVVRKLVAVVTEDGKLPEEAALAPLYRNVEFSADLQKDAVENGNAVLPSEEAIEPFVPLYALQKKEDLQKYRFYIPEPLKNRAYFRFSLEGNSLGWAIVSVVVFIALSFLLLRLLPQLMQLLDNLIGWIAG